MIFAPLNVAAFFNIPPQLRGAAVGPPSPCSATRRVAASARPCATDELHDRRDQFHSLRLGEEPSTT